MEYQTNFGRFNPKHRDASDRDLSGRIRFAPRASNPNAETMRYGGRPCVHRAKVSPHSKHAQRDHARLASHHLGYRRESKPITVTPKYSQQMADVRRRHAERNLPKVVPMD